MTKARRQAAGRPRILLGLWQQETPESALARAVAVATSTDAELHVVRVLDDLEPTERWSARLPSSEMDLSQQHRDHASTVQWLSQQLDRRVAPEMVEVVAGDFVEKLAERALSLRPKLIVVAPKERHSGGNVASLARLAKVPVLVARGRPTSGAILAATDLLDWRLHVLRQGVALGQALKAPVVALHNVQMFEPTDGDAQAIPSLLVPISDLQRTAAQRLSDAASEVSERATPVVSCHSDSVSAIVAEARRQNADVVVVGTHYRKWWGRMLSSSVGARVVDATDRSVLMTAVPRAN